MQLHTGVLESEAGSGNKGRESGEGGRMCGPLEVTRIIGGHWGTLAAKLAMLQSVSRVEAEKRPKLIGPF